MSLPNPGFDATSFDNSAFDCTLPSETHNFTGIANRRVAQEWYVCDRCGGWYPRTQMMNQNGLNVCTGAATKNCWDKPGHAVAERQLDIPYEERPEPLPWTDEEL